MSTFTERPTVYVIAGPNGAGKTTFATEFLPNFVNCHEFLNADLIAAGLPPSAPETRDIQAASILLERFHELSARGVSFSFETTLAGRSYRKLLSELKSIGYQVAIFFLWLPSEELAVARVANRVLQGGHNIRESDIRRRFGVGLRNFVDLYRPIADAWWIFNAQYLPPELIATGADTDIRIVDEVLYNWIVQEAGRLK